jgi:hypothetical protein
MPLTHVFVDDIFDSTTTFISRAFIPSMMALRDWHGKFLVARYQLPNVLGYVLINHDRA